VVPALDIHSDISKTKVILWGAYVTNPTMLPINVFEKVKIKNKANFFTRSSCVTLIYIFFSFCIYLFVVLKARINSCEVLVNKF